MTDHLDVIARRAADDLSASTAADPEHGLSSIYAGAARRRSHLRLAAAAVVLLAVSAGWFGRSLVSSPDTAPSGRPHRTPSPSVKLGDPNCLSPDLECLGNKTYLFELTTPVRWHIPTRFGVDSGSGVSATEVESYWTHRGNTAGVTITEMVRPAVGKGTVPRAFRSGLSPQAFASWLASRPYLQATKPARTTMDGLPAWQVRVRLAPHAGQGSAICSGAYTCHPLMTDAPDSFDGVWDDMVSDYTFVTLPSGTAVVWSWAFGNDTAALDLNQELVAGISWPVH